MTKQRWLRKRLQHRTPTTWSVSARYYAWQGLPARWGNAVKHEHARCVAVVEQLETRAGRPAWVADALRRTPPPPDGVLDASPTPQPTRAQRTASGR